MPTNNELLRLLSNQGLDLGQYDYVVASPNFENTTGATVITFRLGGAAGAIAATLTLSYVAGKLVSIART